MTDWLISALVTIVALICAVVVLGLVGWLTGLYKAAAWLKSLPRSLKFGAAIAVLLVCAVTNPDMEAHQRVESEVSRHYNFLLFSFAVPFDYYSQTAPLGAYHLNSQLSLFTRGQPTFGLLNNVWSVPRGKIGAPGVIGIILITLWIMVSVGYMGLSMKESVSEELPKNRSEREEAWRELREAWAEGKHELSQKFKSFFGRNG